MATAPSTESQCEFRADSQLETSDCSFRASPPSVKNFYLAAYSSVHFFGWFFIASQIVYSSLTKGVFRTLETHWDEFSNFIWFLQLLVWGDVLHLLLGIVPSRKGVPLYLIIHCKVLVIVNVLRLKF